MREKLTKDLGLRLLSIVLAVVVWLIVVNISNPQVTRSKTVVLNVLNENVITGADKTYAMNSNNTVTVYYEVRTVDEYKIKPGDFVASIDLADLYAVTGSVPVNVEVVGNRDIIVGTPVARPGVIRITTEDVQVKQFDLTYKMSGTLKEGYSSGDVSLTPASVSVSGPVSLVGQISSVGIEIDCDGADNTLSGEKEPKFYDANGNDLTINDDRLHISPALVSYSAQVLHSKTVPVNYHWGGTPATNYQFGGIIPGVSEVNVEGVPEILESINSIEIPASVLNIDNATEDIHVNIDLAAYLPEGAAIIGDSNETVILKVEALQKRTILFTTADISQLGGSSGYAYSFSPETIMVEISGTAQALAGIKASDLDAEVDVTQLTQGTHDGTLTFAPKQGVEVKSFSPFKIVVSDAAEETSPTESSDSESASSQTSESESNSSQAQSSSGGSSTYAETSSEKESTSKSAESTTHPESSTTSSETTTETASGTGSASESSH